MAETGWSIKVDHNVWKCTCGAINDWGAPCKRGHGHANLNTGDIRLWECGSCGTYNGWERRYCSNGTCQGRYVSPG